MKYFIIIFLILVFSLPTKADSLSTLELAEKENSYNKKYFIEVNDKLEKILDKIKIGLKEDELFLNYIFRAQYRWENYRDSMVEALFPEIIEERPTYYGILYPTYECSYKAELTKTRISELKRLVELRCFHAHYGKEKDKSHFCYQKNLDNLFEQY